MNRTFDRKHHDESTLTTLCPRCLDAFRNARGIRVRRADYYIQPSSPKAIYMKKGHFDDEADCA